MYCKNCNRELPDDSLFCPYCGEETVDKNQKASNLCSSCGKEIPEDSEFCPFCGSRALINKCKKCNREIPEGSEFCPFCGESINPTEKPYAEALTKTETKSNDIIDKPVKPNQKTVFEIGPNGISEKKSASGRLKEVFLNIKNKNFGAKELMVIVGSFAVLIVVIIGAVLLASSIKNNIDIKKSSEKYTFNTETEKFVQTSSDNNGSNNSYSLNTVIDGTVVFAICAEFDRFEYPVDFGGVTSANKHYDGFDIQLAKFIADRYENELLLNYMEFEEMLESVESKESDGVMYMSITDLRKQYYDFSDTYYNGTQVILVLKDSGIKTISDLNGKQVATGPISATWELDEMSIKYTEYESIDDCINQLKNKNCDAVVLDSSVATYYCSRNSNFKMINSSSFEDYQLAIAVRKGNYSLLKKFNEAIMEFKNNGTMDRLIEEYLIN